MALKHVIIIDDDAAHLDTSEVFTPRKRVSTIESRSTASNSKGYTSEGMSSSKPFLFSPASVSDHGSMKRHRSPTQEDCEHLDVIEILEANGFDEGNTTPGASVGRKRANKLSRVYEVIDLDAEGDTVSDNVAEIDRIYTNQQTRREKSPLLPERNRPIALPWISCQWIETTHGALRPGATVEIQNGDFLFLKEIIKNCATGKVSLRGYHLQRTRDLNGILPKLKNELCWNVEIELDDPRHYLEQCVEEVPLEEVVTTRQLRLTNKLFPACSFRDDGFRGSNSEIEREAPLTLRWRYSCNFNTAKERIKNEYKQRSLEMLSRADLAGLDRLDLAAREEDLRSEFRGYTDRGGGHILDRQREPFGSVYERIRRRVSRVSLHGSKTVNGSLQPQVSSRIQPQVREVGISRHGERSEQPISINLIDLETNLTSGLSRPLEVPLLKSTASNLIKRAPGQTYTYGDGFSGAGGATRGAVMAGLHPKWAMDNWAAATQTFKMNFADVHVYEMWADQFVRLANRMGKGNDELKVDILHLSPPCQFFSPAHTVPGRDDEMNTASLFACGEIIDAVKPRIVTLEQTAGIVNSKHRPYFNALIHMFTRLNFSIRWQVAPLQNWGLPARRARLIMIAACPGEALPEFPPFTHSLNGAGRLKPCVSAKSVLQSIPPGTPDHNPDEVTKRSLPIWDAESILPKCITTSGGQNYHPSGLRDLTNREFAALQGFPNDHIFGPTCQTSIKRQIGNGVPPCVGKVLFEWIRKHLEKIDGIDREAETIVID